MTGTFERSIKTKWAVIEMTVYCIMFGTTINFEANKLLKLVTIFNNSWNCSLKNSKLRYFPNTHHAQQ